ncbi:MAG TPA: hypothetical protein DCP51_00350 [Clostridiales bacterium]|nr:MAG: hypothetical protein A2X42_04065 [Candidatus Margulisbacteria bacterium GWF2_38_17]OGI07160.1 MAG: hypothetical protein A2X41_06135 [Candidatus Margulisbacteria bacterium GWE2_39_32]HAN20124.1 hypothetical protein [Clostridiales bacterium]HCT84725.1 hypothetical protein [Candidatus Margulisiibacteriota bacterium]
MSQKELSISEVQFSPIRQNNSLIGFCSFILNDHIKINGVAVHSKLDGSGWRLTFPKKNENTIIHPISLYANEVILDAVTVKLAQIYGGNSNANNI